MRIGPAPPGATAALRRAAGDHHTAARNAHSSASARFDLAIAVAPWLIDYVGIIRTPADVETLLNAKTLAMQWGVPIHVALFTGGLMLPEDYATAIAGAFGIPFAGYEIAVSARSAAKARRTATGDLQTPLLGLWRGAPAWIVCATDATPAAINVRLSGIASGHYPVVLVTSHALTAATERALASTNVRTATHALKRQLPLFSAARRGPAWHTLSLVVVLGTLAGGYLADPGATVSALTLLLVLPFLGTTIVRMIAVLGLMRPSGPIKRTSPRCAEYDLPIYTVMVALYDEAAVLPNLVAALGKLDYPQAKLDCLLIIEDVDTATKAALLALALPSNFRVVIVPEGQPRTKPRALNYALTLARGDYVAIYDAEDRPDPDQLREALAAFETQGPKIACVQACLNIYNPTQSWLTRQFTVEYSALFDCVLPTLQRLRLPIPLGGTSNHFPRATLAELVGWDPYNVTEDADLGIRIARRGYQVAMIPSTTWEEAPVHFKFWLKQRTRWLKGWMQTYLVHTRQLGALRRDLGTLRTLGFHIYLGGLILSALVHPLFYAVLAADLAFDIRPEGFETSFAPILWLLALINLGAGYAVSITVGIIAVWRRGHRLTLSALLMPLYWLLISAAAYRALWQLHRDPYNWEKTPHGLARPEP